MDQVKQLGYESTNIILNLGTLYVLMVVYFLKVALLLIIVIPMVKILGRGKTI